MRRNFVASVACVSAIALLSACGGSVNVDSGDDTGTGGDASTLDTSGGDAASDTTDGHVGDTSGSDTSPGDSTSIDTAPIDTGIDTLVDVPPTCDPPKKICSGSCVDTSSDNSNCGDCSVVCGAGDVCTSGVCKCPGSKIICGSACVDVSSDPLNCGGCGKPCPTGGACVSGVCAACASPKILCGSAPGACVDPSSDAKNCGACGHDCGSGTCVSGVCACATPLTKCGGTCVDTSTDSRNCGSCGTLCAGTCASGTCTTAACSTAAPSVLFYGPHGSVEKPDLPTGATSTVADDATWRAMTTADFAKYDIVIIGSVDTTLRGSGDPTTTTLQAVFDTRATWGAAINGRVVVLGLDPGFHAAAGTAGATTFLKATLSWLATGPVGTTALYVNSDWGTRNLDFLSSIGAFTSTALTSNTITITAATHPIMIGSTSGSLSAWGASSHSTVTFPATFSGLATATDSGGGTGVVAAVNDVACTP